MQTQVIAGSIVVGVDGSEPAERAVAWAAREAMLAQRPLLVLHSRFQSVIRDTAWLDAEGIDHVELRRALDAAAHAILDSSVVRAGLAAPGVEVEALLVDVDPRSALADASELAELVVVGARGRGPIGSLALGSVSTSVTRHARGPVVVCRPPTAPGVHGGVVVGADGRGASRPVLEFAFRQASLLGLPLTVIPCFWDMAPPAPSGSEPPPFGEAAEQRLELSETVAGLSEKFTDVEVQVQLSRGLVDECLIGSPPAADLVVVGRRDGHGWHHFLQASCALAVLERAHCTVAVVPESRSPRPADRSPVHPEVRKSP